MAIIAVSLRGEYFSKVMDGSVTAETYVKFLREMCVYFSGLQQPLLMQNMQVINDNARPHTVNLTTNILTNKNIKMIKHSPYSPDPNLCNRFVFPRLESIRNRLDFVNTEDLQQFLNDQLPTFTRPMKKDLQAIIDAEGCYL